MSRAFTHEIRQFEAQNPGTKTTQKWNVQNLVSRWENSFTWLKFHFWLQKPLCVNAALVWFLIGSQSSLPWRNRIRKKLILQECKGILKQVASVGEVENLWTTISCVQLKRLKSLNFRGSHSGNFSSYLPTLKISKSSQLDAPDFCRTKVLPDVFNRSNFEYSAFSDLKKDSGRRKRKKVPVAKKMQNKKNSIYSSWGTQN